MAIAIGNPGESAASRGMREWGIMVAAIVVLLVVPSVWAVIYFSKTLGTLGLLSALAGLVIGSAWRRRDFVGIADEFRDSSKWLKGAQGEFLVHKELAGLPDEFAVFHDFHPRQADGRPSKWNVDHIVVGPTGVFVLDAKNYAKAHVSAARKNAHTKRNVDQAQGNALDLKNRLKTWSSGALADVFVVPVVVYAQERASIESLREGSVRVLPLRLLNGEIQRHTEAGMDLERAGRVALALFSQLPSERQILFKTDIDNYVRANRADRRAEVRTVASAPPAPSEPPTVCPLCGGALVRRIARKGERTGKAFLGCENFAKTGCKYGFNLD